MCILSTNIAGCLPGIVGCVSGGRCEGLTLSVRLCDSEVILLPAGVFTQDSVGLVQLNKLAVQRWVVWVSVWVQLQRDAFQ